MFYGRIFLGHVKIEFEKTNIKKIKLSVKQISTDGEKWFWKEKRKLEMKALFWSFNYQENCRVKYKKILIFVTVYPFMDAAEQILRVKN